MVINYLAVLVSAIIAMGLGFVWHGPLFGKKFMAAMGMTIPTDPEVRKKMQKAMAMTYVIQFLLFVVTTSVLSIYINYGPKTGLVTAVCLWLGFVMPTAASAALWNDRPTNAKWTIFLVSAGFNLVMLAVAGLILGSWR